METRKQVVLISLLLMPLASAEYAWHSTSFEFETMLGQDLEFLRKILSASEAHATELDTIKKSTHVAAQNAMSRLSRVEEDYLNPISYFRLIDVLEETKYATDFATNRWIRDHDLSSFVAFPDESDRIVVLRNLYKMQKSYGMKTHDLANGIISGSQGHKMKPDDCTEMADIALRAGDDEFYVNWTKEALRMMSLDQKYSLVEQKLRRELEAVEDRMACERLCTEKQEVARVHKGIKCLMWDGNRDPWLLLQPVKMEVLDTNPYVYRFYDVISDGEIEVLKMLSRKRLDPARTEGDASEPVTFYSNRVAHHYYTDEDDHEVVARLDDRVSRITGLDLSFSEELQIATYGIGGHYVPHYDAAADDMFYGRTATFMFYLSDIEKGGATVFVKPEIAILPQKGSAVLWYNLLPSGHLDLRTKHCACRVILGTKWIANKWIHAERLEAGTCRKNEGLANNDK